MKTTFINLHAGHHRDILHRMCMHLRRSLLADLDTIELLIPLLERVGIDLDDSALDKSVGTHDLVGCGVVCHIQKTSLAGNSCHDASVSILVLLHTPFVH